MGNKQPELCCDPTVTLSFKTRTETQEKERKKVLKVLSKTHCETMLPTVCVGDGTNRTDHDISKPSLMRVQ